MASFSLEKLADVYKFSEQWTRIRFIGAVSNYCQILVRGAGFGRSACCGEKTVPRLGP